MVITLYRTSLTKNVNYDYKEYSAKSKKPAIKTITKTTYTYTFETNLTANDDKESWERCTEQLEHIIRNSLNALSAQIEIDEMNQYIIRLTTNTLLWDKHYEFNVWYDDTQTLHSELRISLLKHLLDNGYDPQDYINAIDDLEQAKLDTEQSRLHPEMFDEEEMSFVDGDVETWEEAIAKYTSGWKQHREISDEELELEHDMIREWIKREE